MVGGSPELGRDGDGDQAEGCADEGVGRLSLARLVRSVSTSELGRRYWRGRRWPVKHQRRRSTVAGEAEEAAAGDELAPGPEVHSASSSGVLRGEEKVRVWFPSSDEDRVLGKGW
jgi:hypothetical protein